ncbi:MAG: tyrosine-type recombinase/integrase [Lachnospiraceae bacterium]|nr:tyrosine-type recombinase/integrase [Lachnospiraceae bacterium]
MSDYKAKKDLDNEIRLNEIVNVMPSYVKEYLDDVSTRLEPSTRLAYAVNIKHFFDYLIQTNSSLNVYYDITLKVFGSLTRRDIVEYLGFSKAYYDKRGKVRHTTECGFARKLSAIRALYNFLIESGNYPEIKSNPASHVKTKLHKKEIITLEDDEIQEFLDYVKNKDGNEHSMVYYNKTKYRDIAIMLVFLGTGIRVSELVGLNIYDVDLTHNSLYIVRKGAKEQYVYFNDKVKNALYDYIDKERFHFEGKATDKTPLFYSMQKKRINAKTVTNLVKKYTKEALPNKRITAHKLRSTYATNLYKATGDIYLVKDALGHENISTVQRYAKNSDTARKEASKNVDWT